MNLYRRLLLLGVALCGAAYAANAEQLTSTISWEVKDSVLYITGTGEMPNFSRNELQHWQPQSISETINAIVIGEGITKVGNYAFYSPRLDDSYSRRTQGDYTFKTEQQKISKYHNVKSITLPSTLKEIGTNAFQNLSVPFINIPNSVTKIGGSAFAYSELRCLRIPSKLTKMGVNAFEGIESLRSIDFNHASFKLPNGAFFMCVGLNTIRNAENVEQVYDNTFGCTAFNDIADISTYAAESQLGVYLVARMMPWEKYCEANQLPEPKISTAWQTKIETDIRSWEHKTRNESELQWHARVNDYTRSVLRDSLTQMAAAEFPTENEAYFAKVAAMRQRYDSDRAALIRQYYADLTGEEITMFRLDNFSLEPYDSERGVATIQSDHYGTFVAPVSADEAQILKANLGEIMRNSVPTFRPKGEDVALRTVQINVGGRDLYAAIVADEAQ